MSQLDDIPIHVVPGNEKETPILSVLVQAILNEINTHLLDLLNHKSTTSIDLRSMPLMPGDYEALRATLGEGEVSAVVEAMGPSEIRETLIPGVWWVIHRNTENEVMTELIEITRIPSILETSPDDLAQANKTLKQRIQQQSET